MMRNSLQSLGVSALLSYGCASPDRIPTPQLMILDASRVDAEIPGIDVPYDRIPLLRDVREVSITDVYQRPDACIPEPCDGVLVNERRRGPLTLCVRFSETAMRAGLGIFHRFQQVRVWDDNRDNSPDLLLVRGDANPSFFHNDGTGHFREVTALVGLGEAPPSEGAAIGDFNGDSLLDIYFYGLKDEAHWTEPGVGGVLYQRMPAGFVRVPDFLTAADQRLQSHAAVFVSGMILFGTEQGLRAYQYENSSWQEVNTRWNISDRTGEAHAFATARIEGRTHIYVANPTGANRHFVFNPTLNSYERQEDVLGTRASGASVAAAWVTLNPDDTPSLIVGNYQGFNYVFSRDRLVPDGGIGLHFTDQAQGLNLRDPGPTFDIVGSDTVGDGHPSIFIARAQDPSLSQSYPNLFYLPILAADGRVSSYRDIATGLGLAGLSRGMNPYYPHTYSAASNDIDNDGKADLVLVYTDTSSAAATTGGIRVFHNETRWVSRCSN